MAKRKDKILSNTEKMRRFLDKSVSIDDDFEQAFSEINRRRRNKCRKSLVDFVNTYCVGLLLDDPPPEKGEAILKEMQKAISAHGNYLIAMPRGHGKTSYIQCATLWALAYGIQKYVVIVSANARQAGNLLNDLWRVIYEKGTDFSNDFPEICLPFQLTNGSFRRRQLYKGNSTSIQKNASEIVFARLVDDNSNELPTSQSLVEVRGVTGGLRGMKHNSLRPSLVLLDDLQTSETAESPEQVQKLMMLIKKDIMSLGGKERLSILQTGTPILPDDLIEKIKEDKNWKTTIYKAVESYPKNKDLWKKYFEIYDNESIDDKPHTESLQFYRANFDEMNEGAKVFNPNRYSEKDGHISAIQKLLEIKHIIGDNAFQSEYQMNPIRAKYRVDITPQIVAKKINTFKELEIPDGFVFTCGAIDLNTSYAITACLMAFKTDMTSVVIWDKIFPCAIDQKLTQTQYNQEVYNMLAKVCKSIKSLNLRIDGIAVDAGGKNWDAVCQFTKNSINICGLNTCAFAGRSSLQYNPFIRTRLRNASGQTVLCGDAEERVKAGSGQKYVFFNADYYKEVAQRAFLAEVLAPGSCSLFEGGNHTDFCMQICNERLQFKIVKGNREVYQWETREPHDKLDCIAMCHAVAAQMGLTAAPITGPAINQRYRPVKKPKIRII